MEFENKTFVKKAYYNFELLRPWFKTQGLEDKVDQFLVSTDGSEVIKITFKSDLTEAQKQALVSKFPTLSQK